MCIFLSSLFLALSFPPSPSLSHMHTHIHTQQNSLLESGRQKQGIYFWQAPEEASGTGNLLPLPFSNLSKTPLS